MTDWESLKVADLKEELKSRGVPLTGLKLKQHFIDKLNEIEAATENESETIAHSDVTNLDAVDVPTEDKPRDVERIEETTRSTVETPERNSEGRSKSATPVLTPGPKLEPDGKQHAIEEETEGSPKSQLSVTPADDVTGTDRLERLPDNLPKELRKEESNARDGHTPPPVEVETVMEQKNIEKTHPFILQEPSDSGKTEKLTEDTTEIKESLDSDLQKDLSMGESSDVDEESKSRTEAASSTRVPTPEILDDRRKRKRRSETPVPESQDIAYKKAKANDGSLIPTQRESDALRKIQEATDAAQAIRNPELSRDSIDRGLTDEDSKVHQAHDNMDEPQQPAVKMREGAPADRELQHETQQSTSPSPERNVSPAIHPATRSLYIRNFKRPLHIPTLRAHISSLAGSSDQDPLSIFYLDSIRTHAFVSFKSISAASRVRNAMHGTRFPDELMREMLWIDFIPDEKVQNWIDQETGNGGGGLGGGRASSKKYEVVYFDSHDSVEAVLQEASTTHPLRPGLQQSRSSRGLFQDPTSSASFASNISSSRTSLMPHLSAPQSQPPKSRAPARSSDAGKGFHALDELFSSTTTKPKLYFKLPSQALVDDRLSMMRSLRVNHDQMGQSGDEGMKRYSFEKDTIGGREEWVDKGPEFGFGRRGQERLTGSGSIYSGGRGWGGGSRGASRRTGDSWRGR